MSRSADDYTAVVDDLRFEIIGSGARPGGNLVNFIVNGRDLVGILRDVEPPFAAREGEPDLAGSYIGLPPEHVFLPSPRLLGEPTTDYDREIPEGKTAILGCECGEVGCWPFCVEITLREDVVVWSGFEQPHRPSWRYDELRPFVFDRRRYFSALDRGPGNSATVS